MPDLHPVVELHRADPRTTIRLESVQRACLIVCGGIAFIGLLGTVFPTLSHLFGWTAMSTAGCMAVFACTASLGSLNSTGSPVALVVSRFFAVLGALTGLASLASGPRTVFPVADAASWAASSTSFATKFVMAPSVAAAFVLLGIVFLMLRVREPLTGYMADMALLGVGWLVLTMFSATVYGAFHVFSATAPVGISPLTIAALALLTVVAFVRRAEYGAFDIFLGRGIGSRVARGVLPVCIVLPFFREVSRARLIRVHMLPEHYAAAMLSALGTVISVALLVIISRQFRQVQSEVQDLSLRDELTGLYNLRGFQLLAGQAFRTSQRTQMPFSVLFVDVDNLKQINDELGHGEGSRLLIQTADFLHANFRESDVVARIGGDEFAVAGHFNSAAIELAESRLEAQSSCAEGKHVRRPHLSLSIGHVTADPEGDESLTDLLHRADAAMYERKRLKKLQVV